MAKTPRKKKAPNLQPVANIPAPVDLEPKAAEFPLHLDLRLTREQSIGIRRLTAGLDKQQATVPCGRPQNDGQRRVTTNNDAVRWFLQQLHDKTAAAALEAREYLETTSPPPPTTPPPTTDEPRTTAPPMQTGTTGPPDFT